MTSTCLAVLQEPSKMLIIRTGKNFGPGKRREFAGRAESCSWAVMKPHGLGWGLQLQL